MSIQMQLTEKFIRNCAPTLANIKTGSLFSCCGCEKCDVYAEVRKLNRLFVQKGLRAIPIGNGKNNVLIYLYRVKSLNRDLSNTTTKQILKECGYTGSRPEFCIKHLIKRIQSEETFPHEIGLFLGYPPEDVRGFMEYGPKKCLLCGKWKVYHDPETAARTFGSYRRCEESYRNCYERGWSLERLVVAG